ncbi:MAG: hypothetical protein KatS3mg118_1705 [Paracoccaceae bacterium]|nr:MAG: hypothetical protein KatS3mg118_1705 [Paracoccaceae bacterium]
MWRSARATVTSPVSSGWRRASSTLRANSASSSRNSTPRCARLTSPGVAPPGRRPPVRPWRRRGAGPGTGGLREMPPAVRPLMLRTMATSRAAAGDRSGKRPGSARGQHRSCRHRAGRSSAGDGRRPRRSPGRAWPTPGRAPRRDRAGPPHPPPPAGAAAGSSTRRPRNGAPRARAGGRRPRCRCAHRTTPPRRRTPRGQISPRPRSAADAPRAARRPPGGCCRRARARPSPPGPDQQIGADHAGHRQQPEGDRAGRSGCPPWRGRQARG